MSDAVGLTVNPAATGCRSCSRSTAGLLERLDAAAQGDVGKICDTWVARKGVLSGMPR